MTTHDRDKVIAAAKECGFAEWENTDSPEFLAVIAEFYAIAHEAGRQAEREDCAVVCEEGTALTAFQNRDCYRYAYNRAKAIRARGDTK